MLFQSYLHYLKECPNFQERHQIYLTQKDFDENPVCLLSGVKGNGSLRLVMSNDYFLQEDIIINFNPDDYYFPTLEQQRNLVSLELQNRGFNQRYLYPVTQDNGSFDLGFFGAIIIEADNITLNGNGKTIKMSEQYALNQRFFSIINLGSAPFIPRNGPGNFGEIFRNPHNTIIKNIKLGRSSHNGILGNDVQYLSLENVISTEWEVSGITLNNADFVTIKDCQFKNVSQNVLVNGSYAQFFFTFQKLRELSQGSQDEILNETYLYFLKVYQEINCQFKKGKITNQEFKNPTKLTDGLQYGISISQKGPSIGGFNICQSEVSDHLSENIKIENVLIANMKANPVMIRGFYQKRPLILAIGRLLPENYQSLPTVMKLLKFYKYNFENKKNYQYAFFPFNLTKENVNHLLNHQLSSYLPYVNADVMNHLSKPIMGIRAQKVKKMKLHQVKICNLKNVGKCFKLNGIKHPESDFENYQGANTLGLCQIKSEIKVNQLDISGLISCHGKTKKIFNFPNSYRDNMHQKHLKLDHK